MKSTVTFKEFFKTYVENMTAGDVVGGSSGGFSPDNPMSKDTYATGDMRIATPSKVIQKRSGALKIKSKRKRKR